jgi:hypothetical protein
MFVPVYQDRRALSSTGAMILPTEKRSSLGSKISTSGAGDVVKDNRTNCNKKLTWLQRYNYSLRFEDFEILM